MEREIFDRHFRLGAARAVDFARQFLSEPLPDAMLFRVHLNSSHDGNATSELKLFPEDSSTATTLRTKRLSADEVIELLWRDGFVPQWGDLTVVGTTEGATIVEVLACGRFIDDETRLYYAQTDCPPFGVKGPTFPASYVEGTPFSIYDRSSCWSLDELARVSENAQQVWSLELHGPAFDDATLTTLAFPKLHILELFDVTTHGAGLAGLGGLPELRHLRVNLAPCAVLDLSGLPALQHVESLSIRSLPEELRGTTRLAEAFPALTNLSLEGAHRTRADHALDASALRRLSIDFPVIPDWIRTAAQLVDLSIHALDATDDDVERLLATCGAPLENLHLRGTPATDSIITGLSRFPNLKYLDVVDTKISTAALERFVAGRPTLRHHPRRPNSC